MRQADPVITVDLFPELRQRLIELLLTVTDEQWEAPTVCAGWSVRDVALHLLGGTIANVSRRRDGWGGNFLDFVPPGEDLAGERTLVTALCAWNETWVLAGRRISPPLLCDLLDVSMRQLEETFLDMDQMAIGDAVTWAGPEPAPVWLDIAREYTEHWTHQAQIRDAIGAPQIDVPRLFAPVLAAFMHALPHTLREMSRPVGTRLAVVVTGPAGGTWTVVREPERWVFADEAGDAPGTCISLDQDTAWRLVTKGLSPSDASSRSTIEGDADLGKAVLAMVAIIA